ncbi:MAG: nucleoside kinase [Pseudomonadota bacterium]
MSNKINIIVEGKDFTIDKDTTLLELIQEHYTDIQFKVLAGNINHTVNNLRTCLNDNDNVEFITYSSSIGREIYRRSLSFLLFRAIFETQRNTRLVLSRSVGNSWYYDFYSDTPVTEGFLSKIEEKMQEYVKNNEEITSEILPRERAREFFEERAYADKVRLLKHVDHENIEIYKTGKVYDYNHLPCVPSAAHLAAFELRPYESGFLLVFPNPKSSNKMSHIPYQPKLFKIHQEAKEWGRILRINNIGRLNEYISRDRGPELIRIAEAFHEKKIAQIADQIKQNSSELKIVFIAGPSSSGKTTFSKRLRTHLLVNGIEPHVISLDDFYLDRECTPKKKDGTFDFEHIKAIDIKLFNKILFDLLKGEKVCLPKFDFAQGMRIKDARKIEMFEDQILIIEGIHGLNEALTFSVPKRNIFKIYISALTQISIDDHNRISTRKNRLIRRMVRDNTFRGYSALNTLKIWPSVTAGEEKWIFPFQEKADIIFNSALFYELSVLKPHIIPLLEEIPKDDPCHLQASNLLNFLKLIKSIDNEADIPSTSILREFIGGSAFK